MRICEAQTSALTGEGLYRFREGHAAALGVVDAALIHSETLRHTCGRELVLAQGLEKAAQVLRLDVNTFRKHYADLHTSDISTDRGRLKIH